MKNMSWGGKQGGRKRNEGEQGRGEVVVLHIFDRDVLVQQSIIIEEGDKAATGEDLVV